MSEDRAARAGTKATLTAVLHCGKQGNAQQVLMCAHDLMCLGLNEGTVLTVTCMRQTVGLLTQGDVAPGQLGLSALMLENAAGRSGDPVSVESVVPAVAQQIMLAVSPRLAPLRRRWAWWRKPEPDPARLPTIASLHGIPLLKGNRLCLTGPEGGWDGMVLETQPPGVVMAGEGTMLALRTRETGAEAASYLDIGGLGAEVSRVREMVELPLRCPELFAHLGVTAPRGVLLYGPPGCGKTLIARAVAQETGAHFINVNGPEIIQKHYGESEELLRNLFLEAQQYPATIIFFDEIDALAPNRETVLGDVEKRVVAQLLALMDGLTARGQIIVIAATNLPNNIDPALRRPGRFDREIGINPPDRQGRLEILRIHSRRMPLALDVDLEQIAGQTHGFFGADIAALCREAAMECARDYWPTKGKAAQLHQVLVQQIHFVRALGGVKLSTTRQLSTENPDIRWSQVGGAGYDQAALARSGRVAFEVRRAIRIRACRHAPRYFADR